MGHQHNHVINNRFVYGILLNVAFILAEVFYGIQSNSLSLIADAAHNASDVLGLLIAWAGFSFAHKKAPKRFTYGYKKASVIAAFLNAILLFAAVGGISWDAIMRFEEVNEVATTTVIIVAAIGVFINGLTAYFFFHDKEHDINIKGAFLHMVLDALISLGVIFGALVMIYTGISWIDPLLSLGIAVVILLSSWSLFKESLNLVMLAAPASVDLNKLESLILSHTEVKEFHDLHIWPMSTTEIALSAHVVVHSAKEFRYDLIKKIEKAINESCGICHITLQLEVFDKDSECATICG
ncbi:MAG: cation diffusion facilitator family transporter [Alphaproteobacteria bacterium]|jgi:cobalt-zinc-cadmium efflux system protein|nr:cation diffusion facilitator family transporter [Candidatus Jidaibacter sp.]